MAGSGLVTSGTGGIGGLFYGNPGYNSATIDPGTQGLINSKVSQSSQTPADYAAADLHGTNQGPDNTAATNFHNALGGPSDAGMNAALQARSERNFGSSLNQLQRQAQIQGVGQQAQNTQATYGNLTQAQNANNAANQAMIQAAQNNANTRASIVTGLFSGGASVAGTIAGSGASPAVGSQAAIDSAGENDSYQNVNSMGGIGTSTYGPATSPFGPQQA